MDKEGRLVFTRNHTVERKDKDGNTVRKHTFTEAIFAQLQGDDLQLTQMSCSDGGVETREFTGNAFRRFPPNPICPK
jgi:sporulation-control protein spo0M